MVHLDKLSSILIMVGIVFVLIGALQMSITLPETTGAGGVVIFIGPIPVFVGWGEPSSIILILVVIMAILTIMGLLLRYRGKTLSDSF
jgi:uncharacterized membrane protein